MTTEITRANVDAMLDSGLIYAAIKNGRWWRIRRNGKTKTWKRDANRVAIPFKYGMYGYGTITETDLPLNFNHYRHADDVPADVKA